MINPQLYYIFKKCNEKKPKTAFYKISIKVVLVYSKVVRFLNFKNYLLKATYFFEKKINIVRENTRHQPFIFEG